MNQFSEQILGMDDSVSTSHLETVVDQVVLPDLELIRQTELKLFLQLQLCFQKAQAQQGYMSTHLNHYSAGLQGLCHDILKLHTKESSLKECMSMGELLDELEPSLLSILRRANTFNKYIKLTVADGANKPGDLLVKDICLRLITLLETHYEIVINYIRY